MEAAKRLKPGDLPKVNPADPKIDQWGADLATKKQYRDFILMLDFRMPTISDSGINFRRLIPHSAHQWKWSAEVNLIPPSQDKSE